MHGAAGVARPRCCRSVSCRTLTTLRNEAVKAGNVAGGARSLCLIRWPTAAAADREHSRERTGDDLGRRDDDRSTRTPATAAALNVASNRDAETARGPRAPGIAIHGSGGALHAPNDASEAHGVNLPETRGHLATPLGVPGGI